MDTENLFKLWFETNKGRLEELVVINNKLMICLKNDCNNSVSYQDIEHSRPYSKIYNSIKNCVEQRNRLKTPLFKCICGVCSNYLMTHIYNNLSNTKSDDILNEIINDIFPTNIEPKHVQQTISNPLDNMILTFGKHKDKHYKDIFNSDREYCIWCIESLAIERSKGTRINDNMVAFVGYVKQCISKL